MAVAGESKLRLEEVLNKICWPEEGRGVNLGKPRCSSPDVAVVETPKGPVMKSVVESEIEPNWNRLRNSECKAESKVRILAESWIHD